MFSWIQTRSNGPGNLAKRNDSYDHGSKKGYIVRAQTLLAAQLKHPPRPSQEL
jgi:hypothetical protein